MRYVVVFSAVTGASTVHREGCRCTTKRPGMVPAYVEASSAPEAVRIWRVDEQADARGLANTRTAGCVVVSEGVHRPFL